MHNRQHCHPLQADRRMQLWLEAPQPGPSTSTTPIASDSPAPDLDLGAGALHAKHPGVTPDTSAGVDTELEDALAAELETSVSCKVCPDRSAALEADDSRRALNEMQGEGLTARIAGGKREAWGLCSLARLHRWETGQQRA